MFKLRHWYRILDMTDLQGNISNEEAELAKVLEESLQTSKARGEEVHEPLNPEQRKRDDNAPCGLKNVGNSKFATS